LAKIQNVWLHFQKEAKSSTRIIISREVLPIFETLVLLQWKNCADPTGTNKTKPKRLAKLHAKAEASKLNA